MIFKFGQSKIDIDVGRTRAFYRSAALVSDNCSCSDCRNYEKAMDFIPKEVITFFDKLGIEMKKVSEVFAICTNADDLVLYGGFYHLCGTLVANKCAWIRRTQHVRMPRKTYRITDDFRIFFHEDCALVAENFPNPVVQLEISANIPWVLSEENNNPKITESTI